MIGFTKILRKRGSGMVIGFFAITILFTLGVSYLAVTSGSIISSKHDVLRARAMACAEAGADKAVSFLMSGGPNGETGGTWRTGHSSSNPDNHNGDTWYTSTVAPGESFKVCCKSGSGITANKIIVTSIGIVTEGGKTTQQAVKVVLDCRKEDVNCWNNAIFAATGQAGKSINGNVKIRGSVHLLGDGESFTDVDKDGDWDTGETYTDSNHNGQYDKGESFVDTDKDGVWDAQEPYQDINGNGTRDATLTVTDLAEEISGNADMGNNYDGMPLALRNKIPALSSVQFGAESVESLKAKLRVKHGKVNISGSATVGLNTVTGNTIKESMDGVYVSDGFGGNAGTSSVHADNGYSNAYDLGDGLVTMPLITYGSYTDTTGTAHTDYNTYLKSRATVHTGDLTISKGTAFSLVGPNGSLVVDALGNMTVSGIVYVNGNINFARNGPITYSGSGTLACSESCYVHCNVLPATKFPTTDALGLIAAKRIELATGSGDAQLSMALAMYAQQQIISNKQNEIAGTMVSSYFSMSNVPKLYQVPELATHLPPGMPGADPIYIATISTDSWQPVQTRVSSR